MTPNDRVRLQHMLEAAQEGMAFCAGKGREEIRQNRVLTLALVRCIEIVGEAASQVGPETRVEVADIPWAKVVAMRNHLIHAYFDIDWDLVFDTVVGDLPPLVAVLKRVLTGDMEPLE